MATTKEAYKHIKESLNDHEAEDTFKALYSILGEEELRDGIVTSMQDEGHSEWIEELLYIIDNKA